MTPALNDALADGATLITPNRRLARHLHREFDRRQLTAGRRVWPTASVLPYAAWLETLWERCAEAGAEGVVTRLLAPAQSDCLWQRVVAASPPVLLDPRGAARLAAEAWALLHGWGVGGESWRAWRRDGAEFDDPATFAAWAEAYQRQLRHADATDIAQLPDVLAANAQHIAEASSRLVFTGFIELCPQQERLISALALAGADIRRLEPLSDRPTQVQRTTAPTPRDEWRAALTWARGVALAHSDARIGIVIDDLAQHRETIVALAEEVLCPERLLAGSRAACRPFEVSLGVALADVPLVRCALDLLALATGSLAVGEAAALLRSPYLGGAASGWTQRARVERDWLDEGRREVTLADAIVALQPRDPELAACWRRGRAMLQADTASTPRAWADGWRAWLAAAGWLQDAALDSTEYQARVAWDALQAEFARLGVVTQALHPDAAVGMLRALAQQRVFQPEGVDASIQVLGVLEASGVGFDALWVAGMAADGWPAAPNPNPLLPRDWQRARNVPHASAARELERARHLTRRFAVAAPVVVFSCAVEVDDHPQTPSALVLDYPHVTWPEAAPRWTQAIAESAVLEAIDDDQAPPLPAGSRAPGGSHIISAQSDCPFQAVARHRLRAEPWPILPEGLSYAERGKLVHATMAALWSALREQSTLAALDVAGVRERVEAAVANARSALPASRWRSLPATVRAAEAQRLAALVQAWLSIELARPAFAVVGVETQTHIELARLEFALRIDRVDALGDGGAAIIDYKTGGAEAPRQWFVPRPRATQLGMYALAPHAADVPLPIRAVAYAQLRPDAIAVHGVAADPAAWPGLTECGALESIGDWTALESRWSVELEALAGEVAQGWAAVTPRANPSPCRNCGLRALCRIDSVVVAEEEATGDE
jgi:ATP-dependent helicase/nuclease subunit B